MDDNELHPEDLEQRIDLLPDREAMSLIATDPHGVGGGLIGGLGGDTPTQGGGTGALPDASHAGTAADPATHTAGDTAGEAAANHGAQPYSPTESASAGS